jgi:pyruvate dehydrogenase E2 component (dihydrolipoamide acetyltransferase)
MNARLEAEGIRQLDEVNIGLAVDQERGLIVPVIRGADRMGLKDLAVQFRELVARAREGKALPDDLTGGTFTITNLGMYGVDQFTPIINLPECAILGVGRIRPRRLWSMALWRCASAFWLSHTFDHPLCGAPAARFLQALCAISSSLTCSWPDQPQRRKERRGVGVVYKNAMMRFNNHKSSTFSASQRFLL